MDWMTKGNLKPGPLESHFPINQTTICIVVLNERGRERRGAFIVTNVFIIIYII